MEKISQEKYEQLNQQLKQALPELILNQASSGIGADNSRTGDISLWNVGTKDEPVIAGLRIDNVSSVPVTDSFNNVIVHGKAMLEGNYGTPHATYIKTLSNAHPGTPRTYMQALSDAHPIVPVSNITKNFTFEMDTNAIEQFIQLSQQTVQLHKLICFDSYFNDYKLIDNDDSSTSPQHDAQHGTQRDKPQGKPQDKQHDEQRDKPPISQQTIERVRALQIPGEAIHKILFNELEMKHRQDFAQDEVTDHSQGAEELNTTLREAWEQMALFANRCDPSYQPPYIDEIKRQTYKRETIAAAQKLLQETLELKPYPWESASQIDPLLFFTLEQLNQYYVEFTDKFGEYGEYEDLDMSLPNIITNLKYSFDDSMQCDGKDIIQEGFKLNYNDNNQQIDALSIYLNCYPYDEGQPQGITDDEGQPQEITGDEEQPQGITGTISGDINVIVDDMLKKLTTEQEFIQEFHDALHHGYEVADSCDPYNVGYITSLDSNIKDFAAKHELTSEDMQKYIVSYMIHFEPSNKPETVFKLAKNVTHKLRKLEKDIEREPECKSQDIMK